MQEKDRISFTGTHPDSLYRVSVGDETNHAGLVARWGRVLRWPAALVSVCFALALFIYYVMPDSTETSLAEGNSTLWEGAVGGQFRHRPSIPIDDDFLLKGSAVIIANNSSPVLASGRNEADFLFTDNVSKNLEQLTISLPPTPPPPSYPSTVTPEVQYGNERPANTHTTIREPKLITSSSSDPRNSSRKSSYPNTKGDLAIFVRDGDDSLTNSTEHIARENTTHTDTTPSKGPEHNDSRSNFTSGHSKVFGLSIEESRRLAATTPSYHTRVSPTLPALPRGLDKYSVSTTTTTSTNEDDLQCRSTNLDFCRSLLPYDLVQSTPDLMLRFSPPERAQMIKDFSDLGSLGCTKRLPSFICHVMEPECTPVNEKPKRPCRKFCVDAVQKCSGSNKNSKPDLSLLSLLNCTLYPETDCVMSQEPCYEGEYPCGDGTCFAEARKCDGIQDCPNNADEIGCDMCNDTHWRCKDSSECVPLRWLCDGYADCPLGEDEYRCSAERGGFFPHPAPRQKAFPDWLHGAMPKGLVSNPQQGLVITDNQEASASNSPVWKSAFFKKMFPEITLPDSKILAHRRKQEYGKGEGESSELLMMSDSSSAALPFVHQKHGTSSYAMNPKIMSSETIAKLRARPDLYPDEYPKAPHPKGGPSGLIDGPDSEQRQSGSNPEDSALFKVLIDDLEKMVDADRWWEFPTEAPTLITGVSIGREGSVAEVSTAHVSPCPAGELRCVDGRCIMYSQLCDGIIDCSDNADEDNCRA